MKIYVLFHSDIEDDKNVRAVFSTRELAEQELPRDEPRDWGWPGARHHGDYCCMILELELDPVLEVWHGPDKPYLGPPWEEERPRLFSDALLESITTTFLRPFPLFDRMKRDAAIGKVHSYTEDERGVSIKVDLE